MLGETCLSCGGVKSKKKHILHALGFIAQCGHSNELQEAKAITGKLLAFFCDDSPLWKYFKCATVDAQIFWFTMWLERNERTYCCDPQSRIQPQSAHEGRGLDNFIFLWMAI